MEGSAIYSPKCPLLTALLLFFQIKVNKPAVLKKYEIFPTKYKIRFFK